MKNKDEPKETNVALLGWFQIIMLMGKPLWDNKAQKWRILNGYRSVLGNTNNMFFEVTFTDTPHWEDFTQKELYLNIPEEIKLKEEQKENKKNKKSPKNNKNEEEKKK